MPISVTVNIDPLGLTKAERAILWAILHDGEEASANIEASLREPVQEVEAPAEPEPKTAAAKARAKKAAPAPEPGQPAEEDTGPVLPPETEAPAAEGPTRKDALDIAGKFVEADRRPEVREALAKVGAKRVSSLEGEQIQAFLDALGPAPDDDL